MKLDTDKCLHCELIPNSVTQLKVFSLAILARTSDISYCYRKLGPSPHKPQVES
jgi:hypothetical protein